MMLALKVEGWCLLTNYYGASSALKKQSTCLNRKSHTPQAKGQMGRMAACDQKLTDWTKMIVEWIQYWFQIVHFIRFKISNWSSFQMWQCKEIHNFASKTGSKLFTSYVSKYWIGHFQHGNSKKSNTSIPASVLFCSLHMFQNIGSVIISNVAT